MSMHLREEKSSLGRRKRRLTNNMKMEHKVIESESADLINATHDTVHWRAAVNKAMNF